MNRDSLIRPLSGLLAALCLTASLLTSPAATVAQTERDECARNLQKIHSAIEEYRRQNKTMPNYLSDLVPNFLASPNLLICPVTKRTGEIKNLGYSDPALSTSYIYDFSRHKVKGMKKDADFTLRDWRQLQMGKVGSIVPCLRCLNHGKVLNMSFDGKLYETEGDWEKELDYIVKPDALSPDVLLAEVEDFATAVRASMITTVPLTNYYTVTLTDVLHEKNTTGPSLKNLPKGRTKFAGVPFDVGGAIHLHGQGLNGIMPERYPLQVTNIVVGMPAEELYFLIGAGYPADPKTKVASVMVEYADNIRVEIPVRYDVEVRDWWQPLPNHQNDLKVAWSGPIGIAEGGTKVGNIYEFSWINPRKDEVIKSIDFVSAKTSVAPFLIGLSVKTP